MFGGDTREDGLEEQIRPRATRDDDADDDSEEDDRFGGGVAIGIERSLIFRDLSSLIPTALATDLEAVLVQAVH